MEELFLRFVNLCFAFFHQTQLVCNCYQVYAVDETCMKKKNLTLAQIQLKETGESEKQMKTRNRPGRSSYLQR